MLLPAQVWLILEPMDMRLGIDGLSARVQHALGKSPCDGTAYAFRNRRGNCLKLLQWDGIGGWLSQRRLHEGAFVWPAPGETVFTLTRAQWQWLNPQSPALTGNAWKLAR